MRILYTSDEQDTPHRVIDHWASFPLHHYDSTTNTRHSLDVPVYTTGDPCSAEAQFIPVTAQSRYTARGCRRRISSHGIGSRMLIGCGQKVSCKVICLAVSHNQTLPQIEGFHWQTPCEMCNTHGFFFFFFFNTELVLAYNHPPLHPPKQGILSPQRQASCCSDSYSRPSSSTDCRGHHRHHPPDHPAPPHSTSPSSHPTRRQTE